MRSIVWLVALSALAGPALAQQPLVLQKITALNAGAPQPAMADLQIAVVTNAKAYAAAKASCSPTSVCLLYTSDAADD